MRISDWSSDVCSSDLRLRLSAGVSSRLPPPTQGAEQRSDRSRPCRPRFREPDPKRVEAPGRGCPHPASTPPAGSEEHTSELQSLMRISYAVFCLKKKRRQAYQYKTLSNYNHYFNI